MLTGLHEHAVDAKGRTILPSRFRGELGQTVYITKGMDRCLWLFTAEAWERVVGKLSSDSMVSADVLALQRHFVGSSVELHPDDQGRIAIPPMLRQFAGIDRDVVTAGMGNRLEIWARERWEGYTDTLTDERIADLGTRISL